MKTYRCKHCKKEFIVNELTVTTDWFVENKSWKNTGYKTKCPFCKKQGGRVSFWKAPFSVKWHMLKEWANH